MKPYKTITGALGLGLGLIFLAWFAGCQDSAVSPEEKEDPWISEIKQMKLLVGEGHNYVVDQIMKSPEEGLDLQKVKAETERFFQMKNIPVDVPEDMLKTMAAFVGPDHKPNPTFRRLAGAETAVGLLDSLLSETGAPVSDEWQTHFTHLAERMDQGEEFDSYIESAEVQDSSLMAHMWFADGIYDSSEAYWGSSLPRTTLNERSTVIAPWIIWDVAGGGLFTALDCGFHTTDCGTLWDIIMRFIGYGASSSLMRNLP